MPPFKLISRPGKPACFKAAIAFALNTAYDPIPRVITPATTYMDEPKTFTYDNQEYSPGNFGESYSHAPVTLRDALVHSLNVVTVDVAMEVTIGRVMNLAAKAGLPKPADDPAIVCGSARFHGLPIVVVGHQKGRDTNQRKYRNFGMPKPEGYRKALRVMKLAEKFCSQFIADFLQSGQRILQSANILPQ